MSSAGDDRLERLARVRAKEDAGNRVRLGIIDARQTRRPATDPRVHLVIGDSQVKPGVCTDHLEWIGRYIVDEFHGRNLAVIHLGDHWDMPSLSSYDEGKRSFEGRRYQKDIEAGNAAFDRLCEPLARANKGVRRPWEPERHLVLGNHEARITRAIEEDARLEDLMTLDHLNARSWGWRVHGFREPVDIDGVVYAHYFYNPMTGHPYGGEISGRLKTIGHSFTMGHQQGLRYGLRETALGRQHGLVLGSTYLHDEEYLGPQGNRSWRGIAVCHQVERGDYDIMMVSLDYLCRRYTGKILSKHMEAA